MAAALDNPKLTAGDKAALLLSIARRSYSMPTAGSFVRVLVDADRIAVLPQIADALRDAEERRRRRGDGAGSTRAFPLTDAQAAELKAALEKRFGKKIEATVNVDPALGGGARITVGDTVIDGTDRSPAGGDGHPIASLNRITTRAPAAQSRRDARTPCS